VVSKDFSDQQGIASLLRDLTSSSTLQNQTPQTTNSPPNFLPPLSTSSKRSISKTSFSKHPLPQSYKQDMSSLGTQALSERGPLPCLQSKREITLPRPFEPEPHSLPDRGLTHPLRASASPKQDPSTESTWISPNPEGNKGIPAAVLFSAHLGYVVAGSLCDTG
jgi:hypothetical protein